MTANQQHEAGVVQAILEQLEQHTLPRTVDIRARVDAGERLADSDTQFLEEVLQGLRRDGPYVQHHPEWEPLYSRIIDLYDQITRRALENEQRR
ncbi:hypothetical protein [Thiohalocapsa sp. ML1]|jgi:hypothetical protein|uniref:hypothetical protein n=1 Tax=Thiohalocapsa sp. ML1 TaxID=1431688 RepID=UPI0007320A52|nr:hypothetical protein [Thiohalocapsa sp. ML1]